MEQPNNRLCSIWSIDSNEAYVSKKLDTRDIRHLDDLVETAFEYQLSSSENLVSYELRRKNLYETWTAMNCFDDMANEFSHEKQQEILHLSLRILNESPQTVSVSFRLRVPNQDREPGWPYCWYLCIITEGKTQLSLLDAFLSKIPGLVRHPCVVNRLFVRK